MVLMETGKVWKRTTFVQEEDGKLIVNTAHKEANQYAQPILR